MPDPILIQFKTDLTAIDNTIDSLEQLGMVDKATADSFRKTSGELKKYQEEMSKTGKQVDAVTIDLEDLANAMKEIPKKIIDDAAKKSLDDTGKSVDNLNKSMITLRAQLFAIKEKMSELEMQGKANTKAYDALTNRAALLEDQIGDTAARVRVLASDTKNLDAALSLATGLAGTFSIAQGATALFGDENEDLQKSLLKVQSALSILNGLQAIQATLNKNSAASVVILSNVQKAYTAYIGQSTGAMLLLKQASIGLGLPALGIAIYAAITAFKAWREEQDQVNAATARMIKINDEATGSISQQEIELAALIRQMKQENLTNNDKQAILQTVNEKYGDQIGHFNSIKTLEEEFIKRAEAYIQVLRLRAQAQAALNLATKEQETLLKEQNAEVDTTISKWKQFTTIATAAITGSAVAGNEVLNGAVNRSAEIIQNAQKDFDAYLDLYNEFMTEAQAIVKKYNFEAKKGATETAKIVREEFTDAQQISPFPSPEELETDVITPSIKIANDYYETLKQIRTIDKESQLADLRELQQANLDHYNKVTAYAYMSFDTLNAISQQALDNRIATLDEQLAKGQLTEEQYAKAAKDAKIDEAKREKQIAFFRSLIAIPEAYLEGLVQGGPPLAFFYAGLAGIQSALIASAKIPQFAKGTKKAPAGMKWVGEEGPELINDGGGYPIIPHKESMAIANAFEKWGVGYDYEGNAIVMGGADIDYGRLAKALAKEISALPISETHFDEHGFTRAVRTNQSRVNYLENRYQS